MACELPARHERPLSRLFVPDIVQIVVTERIVEAISASTVWRILDADALKPWRRRSWIYPRDPDFYARAAGVLDLYAGIWHGKAVRARLALLLAENPTIPNPEAARLLGVHENTIRNWRKRWATEGWCLDDRPRPGRPRLFSLETVRRRQGGRLRTARAI